MPGIALDCGAGPDVRHVGVVFVHGIGSQQAGETLLDWGGSMIRALLDARVRHRASADPVIDCELDPGPSESRYIELQLPATQVDGTTVEEQHWVMTEAWWSQRVRPPSFSQMATWLGPRGAIQRILAALLPRPRGLHDPRLRPRADRYPLRRGIDGRVEEAAAPGPPEGMKEPPGTPIGRAVAGFGGALYLQAVSALVLTLYGVLRSVEKLLPIGPLRNGALTRPIDRFVLEWFGDVYVLLSDPAQAASVRGGLIDALSDLRAAGSDEVVVVAHSGGAIVSYMALADHATEHLHVDRLITLGQGLNLAWRLTAGEDLRAADQAAIRYERLYKDVLRTRPNLRWNDFWSSQDPAPVGVLEFPQPGSGGPDDSEMLARVESHAIWNQLSLTDDHGAYWDNDEEFVLPILRLLEGRPDDAALFGDEAADRERSNRRRRRLSMLSLWRQLSVVAPMAAIVVAFSAGSDFLFRASDAIAATWSAIPGGDAIGSPLVALREMQIAGTAVGGFVAESGVWVIAALIGLATAFALIAPPERPIPWAVVPRATWVGGVMRVVPWLAGIPIAVALAWAAIRFLAGATPAAIDVGRSVAAGGAAILVLAVVVPVIVRAPRAIDDNRPRRTLLQVFDALRMIAVMVIAVFLVAAPVVAIIAFPDVGRTVLGVLAVLAAFQILARIGGWRWAAWDARERMSARTGQPCPGIRHILVQAALLFWTMTALFLAVVVDSVPALGMALASLVFAVLLGIAIDVLASGREDQATPTDSLLRQMKTNQRA